MTDAAAARYQVIIWENNSVRHGVANWQHLVLAPMTVPEVLEWAHFNNMHYVTKLSQPLPLREAWLRGGEPASVQFIVRRTDGVPLNADEHTAFGRCRFVNVDANPFTKRPSPFVE